MADHQHVILWYREWIFDNKGWGGDGWEVEVVRDHPGVRFREVEGSVLLSGPLRVVDAPVRARRKPASDVVGASRAGRKGRRVVERPANRPVNRHPGPGEPRRRKTHAHRVVHPAKDRKGPLGLDDPGRSERQHRAFPVVSGGRARRSGPESCLQRTSGSPRRRLGRRQPRARPLASGGAAPA